MFVAEPLHHGSDYDLLFVAVSVVLAVVGSFAALVSAIRIPLNTGAARIGWTATAALALGGGAIWSMHFMGMIAYHIDGITLTYDVPLTGLSLLIAVAVSALGLAVVGADPHSMTRLMSGGIVAGLGVAAMHYTGMAAMRTGSRVSYEPTLVGASVAIAVAAALAALAIAYRVQKVLHVAVASLVMAVAVCGMHYTAMAATRVEVATMRVGEPGTDPIALGMAACVVSFSVLAVVIFTALGGVTDEGAFQLAAQSSRPGTLAPASAGAHAASPYPIDGQHGRAVIGQREHGVGLDYRNSRQPGS